MSKIKGSLFLKNLNAVNPDRFERDSSGFLKPPQPDSYFVEEEVKKFHELYSKLFDSSLFDEVEKEYHIEKLLTRTQKELFKNMRKEQSQGGGLPFVGNIQNKDRISEWIQSCQMEDPSTAGCLVGVSSTTENVPSHVTSSFTASINEKMSETLQKNAFILKDWSIIKGAGEAELMVSGILINIRTREIIEKTHKSSAIVDCTGNNCVKTVCCTYKLCGNFIGGNDIPVEIKKHFINGKFPESWKKLTSNWHSLNKTTNSSINTTSKGSLQYRLNPSERKYASNK